MRIPPEGSNALMLAMTIALIVLSLALGTGAYWVGKLMAPAIGWCS